MAEEIPGAADAPRYSDGEHGRRRPGCFEYCRMDPLYCPLCHLASGGRDVGAFAGDLWRWCDVELGEAYKADWGARLGPGDVADGAGELYPKWREGTGTGWYSRQMELENPAGGVFSPFSCWGDGSGYEYDIEPGNLVGPSGSMEGLYSVSGYGVSHSCLALGAWNAWAEKFVPDWRFGQVSDLNAAGVLFPDVEDPWMFCEYVFRGRGAFGAGDSEETVVEPELWDPDTLSVCNGDFLVASAGAYRGKYDFAGMRRRYRRVADWSECGLAGPAGGQTVPEAGGRLYCAEINAECAKWGEHGNVPPGAIGMAGPAGWFDPARLASEIRPRVTCHVGRPYRAKCHGIVRWEMNTASFYGDCYIAPRAGSAFARGTDSATGRPIYTYEIPADGGIPQGLPREKRDPSQSGQSLGYERTGINDDLKTGALCHGGCRFLKGADESGTGVLRCRAMDGAAGADLARLESHFSYAACAAAGGNAACPFNVPGPEWPVLVWYEATAANLAAKREALLGIYSGEDAEQRRWADSMLSPTADLAALGDLAGGMGLFSVMNAGGVGRGFGRPDVYSLENEQIAVWYETEFEVVRRSGTGVKTTAPVGDSGFSKGVSVERGSGEAALDTAEHAGALRGDSIFFGDMDQRGFARWFESPMFCADPAYCNDICGINMQAGFKAGSPAGPPPGCRYYKSPAAGNGGKIGCPTNCVQKRAREFQEAITRCSATIDALARMWRDLGDAEREAYNAAANAYWFRPFEPQAAAPQEGAPPAAEACLEAWDIFAVSEDIGAALGGIDTTEDIAIERNTAPAGKPPVMKEFKMKRFARFGRFGAAPQETPGTPGGGGTEGPPEGGEGGEEAPARSWLRCFFWYTPRQNSGKVGYTDCNGKTVSQWFVQTDTSWHKFARNTMIVTNAGKFIGGYHPQYKDYGKRGQEFIQEVESTAYRDAMGDIIGDVDNDGQPQARNRQGYWTDEDGDFVVTEESTGIDDWEIGDDDSRQNPGRPLCISYRQSNTVIDVEQGTNTGPKVINCAVRANDSRESIKALRERGPEYDDPQGYGTKYKAPPSIREVYALPTMRLAAHCPKCNYYLAWKYHDMVCPWCGSRLERITGDPGEGLDQGGKWPGDASVIKKFFKLNAIGRVQVWAPVGTAVPKNGYFWQSPALVRNTLLWQIKFRLGDYDEGRPVTDRTGAVVSHNGGAWKLNWMSREAEMTLGLPEQIGEYRPMPPISLNEARTTPALGKIPWTAAASINRPRFASWNDIAPDAHIPGIQGDGASEMFITPYTVAAHDGLKLASAAMLRALRNRIEPWLAYVSGEQPRGDFQRLRATYEDRLNDTAVRYSPKALCRIDSIIRAANDTGVDSFVQFWSGDYAWGSVREYYPPGLSWWPLNNVIGSRYSDNKGGWYHMDSGNMCGGHRTVAKAAIFLHGIIPLDKEIMRAYMIFEPAGEPSKEPLGRDWQGRFHYEHFHAFTKEHFNDGEYAHLHGQAGTEWSFDENGVWHDQSGDVINGVVPLRGTAGVLPRDESDYRGWAGGSERPGAYRSLFEDGFRERWQGLAGVMDVGFWTQVGGVEREWDPESGLYKYPMARENSDGSWSNGLKNGGLYYNPRCAPAERADEKFRAVGFASKEDGGAGGGDDTGGWLDEPEIAAPANPAENWAELTAEEIARQIEMNSAEVEFSVSTGSPDSAAHATYTQVSSDFAGKFYPRQAQGVAGYMDVGALNSEGMVQTYLVDGTVREIKAVKEADSAIVPQESWSNVIGWEITPGYYEEYTDANGVFHRVWHGPGFKAIFGGGGSSNNPFLPKGSSSSSTGAGSGGGASGMPTNSGGATGYNGHSGGDSNDAGQQSRYLDVTKQVRELYNARIDRDFLCSGGLTLDAAMQKEFPASEWQGVGNRPDWLARQSGQWNAQTRWAGDATEDRPGYLLTDTTTYPKLENGRMPEAPKGDMFPLAGGEISLVASFRLPMAVTALARHWKVKRGGGGDPIEGDLAIGTIATAAAAVQALKTIFGADYEITAISDYGASIKRSATGLTPEQQADATLEIIDVENACYPLFSLWPGEYPMVQNRCVSESGHVAGLAASRVVRGGMWSFRSYAGDTAAAVFDLARAPLEASVRDYRRQRPSIDISGATCPKGCLHGETVAQYRARRKYETEAGTACPVCGADLSGEPGASGIPGDGIKTWTYREFFAEDCFITGLHLGGFLDGQSFAVTARAAGGNSWRPVLTVWRNPATELYTWHAADGSGAADVPYADVPKDFPLAEEGWFRARFVRLAAEPHAIPEQLAFSAFGDCTEYSVEIAGNFAEYGALPWRGVVCTLEYPGEEPLELPIITADISEDFAKLILYFDHRLPNKTPSRVSLQPVAFSAFFEDFRVYGFHYLPGDLTMTGPADEHIVVFSTERHHIALPEYPTQILGIALDGGAAGAVELEEAADANVSLQYKIAPVDIQMDEEKTARAYRITGGNWRFDYLRNRILLPSEGVVDGETNEDGTPIVIQDNAFEKDTAENAFGLSYYPDRVVVRYWSGSGKEIAIEATAEDAGPSYQLERGSIRYIVNADDLPDNGQSVPLPLQTGKGHAARPIPWSCINTTPATLSYEAQVLTQGKFMPPNLPTTALGKAVDSDQVFIDLFGPNCTRFKGFCRTEMLFKGAPDQVLSGEIRVRAKAYDTRVINYGEGTAMFTERTGGLKSGILVAKAEIKPTEGRKTFAWGIPKLLIYARDRAQTDPLLPPNA